MLHVDETCCGLKNVEVSDKKQVIHRMTSTESGGAGRLHPRTTIDALPDDVLLETFELYLDKDDADEIDGGHDYDGWQTLVHVCRRWRCIVFASPRRLDLKLYCTRKRSVNSKTLDIWPALPIVIFAKDMHSEEDVTNVISVLRYHNHNRVCKIYYSKSWQFQDSFLGEFATIDEAFPELTNLELVSFGQNEPVLPDAFFGGSAPRLRSLDLCGIPYPSIGTLLSSTTNLVRLSLHSIPRSGYIAPEAIVPCLSMLPRLESLLLHFQYPRSRAQRESRHPPPLTCVVFPNLALLEFHGDIEYLEDILSQIETPVLDEAIFWFFNQVVFDTPLLGHFIRRTGTFMTIHTARMRFFSNVIDVVLPRLGETAGDVHVALSLSISCEPLDWQLSAFSQVLDSFLSSLQTVESLEIELYHEDWQGEIEVIQWRELLHPFSSVKNVTLYKSARLIAPALQELTGESAMEVLPALQDLFLTTSWLPPGPIKESIEQFIATRQLHGHPVTVHY